MKINRTIPNIFNILMIKKITNIIIQLAIISAFPALTFAAWQGPQDVLSGTWGSQPGQFYFTRLDMGDAYPDVIGIDKNGMILVVDGLNKRIAVYNAEGKLINYIYKPTSLPALDNADAWPSDFVLYPGGNSFSVYCEYVKLVNSVRLSKKCFINYNGDILGKIDNCEIFPSATGYIGKKNNIYTSYDPNGNIIKTNIQWEPEIRDANNNLYDIDEFSEKDTNNNSITTYQVTKYNLYGKKIATFAMPKSLYAPQPPEAKKMPTWVAPPIVEYGKPFIAPNGDVYTWKRTPDKYSIIKWKWVDDPNTPPCK